MYAAAKKARRRHPAKALKLIGKALALRKSSRGWLLKARLQLRMGKKQAALATLSEATRRSPRSASLWRQKGEVHLAMRQFGPAKQALKRYLALRPNARDAEDIRLVIDNL